jgi:putative addiction module component (TIGR02574 family)
MNSKAVLKEALHLHPAERLQLVEYLVNSLDKPDKEIEKAWSDEAEKRYQAYTQGKVKTYDLREVAERYK